MDAQWKEVAAKLAQIGLPVLGKLLGGYVPVAGPIINAFGGGEAVGRIVAQGIALALGVKPTPEAVNAAIENGDTTEVVAKLKTVEAEAQARWPAVAEINKSADSADVEIARINAQTSAEIAKNIGFNGPKQSLYRPILMWVASADLAAVFGIIKYALFSLLWGNDLALKALATEGVWQLLALDVGIAGTILGWHFSTRASERKAAVTAPANAAAAAAASAVRA